MFVEENELVEVEVFYRKIGKNYVAYGKHNFEESVEEIERPKYKKLIVNMKILTWGLYNSLQDESNTFDSSFGRNVFHYKKWKEEKLKKLIIKWDATTEKDGKSIPVPVNEKNILNMAPPIAEAILETYDAVSLIGDEEEKK